MTRDERTGRLSQTPLGVVQRNVLDTSHRNQVTEAHEYLAPYLLRGVKAFLEMRKLHWIDESTVALLRMYLRSLPEQSVVRVEHAELQRVLEREMIPSRTDRRPGVSVGQEPHMPPFMVWVTVPGVYERAGITNEKRRRGELPIPKLASHFELTHMHFYRLCRDPNVPLTIRRMVFERLYTDDEILFAKRGRVGRGHHPAAENGGGSSSWCSANMCVPERTAPAPLAADLHAPERMASFVELVRVLEHGEVLSVMDRFRGVLHKRDAPADDPLLVKRDYQVAYLCEPDDRSEKPTPEQERQQQQAQGGAGAGAGSGSAGAAAGEIPGGARERGVPAVPAGRADDARVWRACSRPIAAAP